MSVNGQRPAGGEAARTALRRIAFASIVVLLVEFLLGLAASLWVTIAHADPWSHIGDPLLLALHALLGAALAAMALVALGRSVDAPGAARYWAGAAAAGTAAALVCGFEFVDSGGEAGWSFAMGLGWAVALLGNVLLLGER